MIKNTKLILVLSILAVFAIVSTGGAINQPSPVVVEGYDITKSVTGTPLKDIYENDFMIGVGLNGTSIQNDTASSEVMKEVIKYHFNSVTYTNLMKPSYLLDQGRSMINARSGNEEPAVKFDSVIQGLEFCQENGIQMRGHTLLWHAQTPEWFFREGYLANGELVDRETMLFRLESYIKQVLEFVQENYPGVLYAWDVVNEAIDSVPGRYETETGFQIRTKHGDDNVDNLWYAVIGVDFPQKAFEYARKYADPEVKLFYNDYNTYQPERTNAIYNLAANLQEKGLIDGIGMQGHVGLSYPGIDTGGDNWKSALEKFGELGLEIHITELTMNIDDDRDETYVRQADRYAALFNLLAELDDDSLHGANVTSVTVFGLMDNYILYDDDDQITRLFDGDLQPKYSFYALVDPTKPWYINRALYEGALRLKDGNGNVMANLLPAEYQIAELETDIDLSVVEQIWLAKGYVLEVFSGSDDPTPQMYIGDDLKIQVTNIEQSDRIVIKENTAENLVIDKPVQASHREERANRAIDGNLISSWSVNEEPPYWLSIDLGEPHVLTQWVVYHRGGGGAGGDLLDGPINTADFKLQVSDDQVTWDDVDVVEDNNLSVTDRAITPTLARYVRLLITNPTSFDFNREAVVYEFEVHGLEVE